MVVGPAVLVALTWLVTRTRFGLLIRAARENRALTAALGIDQARLYTAVFALGAFLAGLAGALQLPREPANLGMDLAVVAEAFVVTVVGGLGSIPGAFLAALIIGLTKALCIALGTVEIAGIDGRVSQAHAGGGVRRDGGGAGGEARTGCSGRPSRRRSRRTLPEQRALVARTGPARGARRRHCCSRRSLPRCRGGATTTRWCSPPTFWSRRCLRRACSSCSAPAA